MRKTIKKSMTEKIVNWHYDHYEVSSLLIAAGYFAAFVMGVIGMMNIL